MHPRFRNLLLTTSALLALGLAPAAAGPEGGTRRRRRGHDPGPGRPGGDRQPVDPQRDHQLEHVQHRRRRERAASISPAASSVALNRVTGGLGPSQILGTLTANGRIFLINRDGILFGPGAVINTAGFLATTNDIKNSDFMAGRMNFNIPGRPDASIVNKGTITATSGGFAALVAPGVRNSGTITAELGTVALASGNSFTLDMYGDKLITLAVGDEIAHQGHRRRHRPAAQIARHQRRQNQGERRTGRAHRRGGAHRGRFRHQHQRRDQGQLDRSPQRHDRAQRRHRRKQARRRADAD